jgi:excisionase family DNA binding protein
VTIGPDTPAVLVVPRLLSVPAVADLLSVSPRTVRRRIAERDLPAVVDHGRVLVRADDLRAYIDRLERIGARPGRARRAAPRTFDFLR